MNIYWYPAALNIKKYILFYFTVPQKRIRFENQYLLQVPLLKVKDESTQPTNTKEQQYLHLYNDFTSTDCCDLIKKKHELKNKISKSQTQLGYLYIFCNSSAYLKE